MAKRELSSALKNLKFMQRGKLKAEEKNVVEKEVVQVEDAFGSSAPISRKCIVVMEGNPLPGAVKGRMSFQSFNPSIDKLNQEAVDLCSTPTPSSLSTPENKSNGVSDRLEGTCSKNDSSSELKRKKPETEPNEQSQHISEGNMQSSQENKKRACNRQQRRGNLDWNALRREKAEGAKGRT